ncbi:MAG: DUF3021 domain-containing protein [Lachnospiraceae bacterium]|nr:DUF3021 domain-containing protein [Lachnospiraceae bacterium]
MRGLRIPKVSAQFQKISRTLGGFTMKNVLKNTMTCIGISMMLFCFGGTIQDIENHGNYLFENFTFTRYVFGSLLVGLGFGLPTIVYQNEHIPTPVKIIIQMGIGCTVLSLTPFITGTASKNATISQHIGTTAARIGIAFFIYLLSTFYYRKEAKILNDRLQKIKP